MSDEGPAFLLGALVAGVIFMLVGTCSGAEYSRDKACGRECKRGDECGAFTCTTDGWR